MAALPRVLQKIFGVSGNNGVVGSAQASAPTLTNDIAVLQSLPAFSTGLNAVVESSKKLPPLEEIQALFNICTTQLAYIFQEGIAEYNSATNYSLNALVKKAGTSELYVSLQAENTNHALTDASWWAAYLGSSNTVLAATIAAAVRFGSAVSKTAGTIYPATTDGILTANVSGTNYNVTVLSDSSPAPFSVLGSSNVSGGLNGSTTITFPISKNNYYQVVTSNENLITFTPLLVS